MTDRALLAACAMALALVACSSEKRDTTAEAPEAAASNPTDTAPMAEGADMAMTDDGAAGDTTSEDAQPEPSATPAEAASATPKPVATPSASTAPATMTKVAATSAVPQVFEQRCSVCHTANQGGEDLLGPNLYGVYGHQMGQGGSFSFSEALKDSGLTMDDATLDAWLENPRKLVPGNRMSFPGLKDAAKRKEIIDYLKKQG